MCNKRVIENKFSSFTISYIFLTYKKKFHTMIVIRTAMPSDLDALIHLLSELFYIEADFQFDAQKQRAGLELLLGCDTASIFVAQAIDSKQVIAMCSLQTLISTAEGGKVGLVEDVIVNAAYRGRGIGKKLVQHLTQWAAQQGFKRLQLLADNTNTPALTFYAQQHWQATQLIALRKRLG